MMPDYHMHTSRCGHARGDMEEYIVEARKKGLGEIGFADHVPMYWLAAHLRDAGLAMDEACFPEYVSRVLHLRKTNPSIGIGLGVEVDYIPGWEKEAAKFISEYPFDYIIGSVHYIDGWGFDNPALTGEYSRRQLGEIYRQYFDLICRAAKSGLFDVIAHPDLVKKFGYRLSPAPVELYRQAARAFAGAGVCVEVNTAGLRAPAGEIYPCLEFLRFCFIEGVPVSTGSDAHCPDLVGAHFSEAGALLREAGYREVTLFRERKRMKARI